MCVRVVVYAESPPTPPTISPGIGMGTWSNHDRLSLARRLFCNLVGHTHQHAALQMKCSTVPLKVSDRSALPPVLPLVAGAVAAVAGVLDGLLEALHHVVVGVVEGDRPARSEDEDGERKMQRARVIRK